ncbi:MAG: DEAD/DEAH box helicase [Spirochaetia bacterium]|jgi:superfamily II DNA or RNA helicase|nr:DEAD/DEAH box helicase [Spirochaetia bacterium]
MELREYQQAAIGDIRAAFTRGARRILLCLPTGAGKTRIAAEIMKSAYRNGRRAWFCVPRLELVGQTRRDLVRLGVPHGEISASEKSFHNRVCVVSRDTVIKKPNQYPPPDLVFFDEAHVAIEQQRRIARQFPLASVIGMTATPERGDGTPLKFTRTGNRDAGLYDGLIQSESIPGLQSQGVLSPLEYYGLELAGTDTLNIGTRPEAGEDLDNILIYGDIADYYARLGEGRQAIGFAPTIHIAQKCVDVLNGRGFAFRLIHGKMPVKERAALIRQLQGRRINGLVNAALLTYGFDAPIVSYAFSVRYIRSRPLWVQMVGRVLRGHPGKENAVFVDHTGTINNFTDDGRGGRYGKNGTNGLPHIFADPDIAWDFEGKKTVRCLFDPGRGCERPSRRKTPRCAFDKTKLCGAPMHYLSAECLARLSDACPKDVPNRAHVKKLGLVSVGGELVNLSAVAVKSKGEAYRLVGRIGEGWEGFTLAQKKEYIRQLDGMARAMGYSALWTYWKINENRAVVDSFTLRQIAELRGYKKGWIYHKENEIREKLNTEKELA